MSIEQLEEAEPLERVGMFHYTLGYVVEDFDICQSPSPEPQREKIFVICNESGDNKLSIGVERVGENANICIDDISRSHDLDGEFVKTAIRNVLVRAAFTEANNPENDSAEVHHLTSANAHIDPSATKLAPELLQAVSHTYEIGAYAQAA
jgi:hypothetical protein